MQPLIALVAIMGGVETRWQWEYGKGLGERGGRMADRLNDVVAVQESGPLFSTWIQLEYMK